MFFIMGISQGKKKLDFVNTMVCSLCGKFGRLEAYMTYTYFSLFFIPLFRWNVEYFVTSTCCGTVYSIDKSLGKRLQRGEDVTLKEEDLCPTGRRQDGRREASRCPSCGYITNDDFDYCPKCGRKL